MVGLFFQKRGHFIPFLSNSGSTEKDLHTTALKLIYKKNRSLSPSHVLQAAKCKKCISKQNQASKYVDQHEKIKQYKQV